MEVEYANNRVAKKLNKLLQGGQFAKQIKKRILEFKAASDLSVIEQIKSRQLHKLVGDRKGQMSVAVSKNWKLIFRAVKEFEDYKEVDAIEILDFTDYH